MPRGAGGPEPRRSPRGVAFRCAFTGLVARWAAHDVRFHPTLLVCTAPKDSPTADSLKLPASWAATTERADESVDGDKPASGEQRGGGHGLGPGDGTSRLVVGLVLMGGPAGDHQPGRLGEARLAGYGGQAVRRRQR